MKVRLNGTEQDIGDVRTISDLVAKLGFGARQVVVEHNGEPVDRGSFASVVLRSGDVVEVVRPVAGG